MNYPAVSLLDMLGDLDLEAATGDELEAAQEYLLFLLENTEDEDLLRDGLFDYGEAALAYVPSLRHPLPFPTPVLQADGWLPVKDGDARARALYERHYSARKSLHLRRRRRTKLFVGPGEKLVLITPRADALFVWRRTYFRADEQWGAECAVFRNEGPALSSDLIRQAEIYALRRWPYLARFYTYIDAGYVQSANPGYCFQMAGWRRCGESTKGLILMEKLFLREEFLLPWNKE